MTDPDSKNVLILKTYLDTHNKILNKTAFNFRKNTIETVL